MKKLICYLLFTGLLFQGCQKLLREDSQNVFELKTPEDLTNAVTGLYHRFSNSMVNTNAQALIGNGGDITITHASGYIQQLYNVNYQVIACANDIIKKTKNLPNNEKIRNMLGEVYLIRGWSYFNLARCFGQIPLVNNTDMDYSITKPTYTEVYDFIQSDIQRAIDYLPGTLIESRIKYVTPTRGTAKAIMAEVLLTRGGYPVKDPTAYKNAWKIAQEVIDSASNYNYELIPDFAYLWDGRHDMNHEGVFSLFYLTLDWNFYGQNPDSLSSLPKFKNYDKIQWDHFIFGDVGVAFYNNYPNQYRKNKTYDTYLLTDSNAIYGNGEHFHTDTLFVKWLDANNNKMRLKKYYSAVDSTGQYDNGGDLSDGNSYTGHVLYLLRYAHILLTYAEAKARDGQSDSEAYEFVNQIRRRANHVDLNSPSVYDLPTSLSTEAFIDSVVWERALEFCGEPGNRWFDILRTEQVKKYNSSSFPINTSTHFYEIPDAEKYLLQNFK